MSAPENGGPAPLWRVQNLERRVDNLERHDLGRFDERLKNVEAALKDVRDSQQANNRVLWMIAVALIAAALTLAISIASGTLG